LKGVRTLIIDENDQIAGPGAKGELCIGGDQVMEGYLSPSPDESGVWFMREENGIREKYYRSGDLVIQDEQGYLSFCGRKDDQLKISGYRIEPAEIERAISQVTSGMNSKVFGFTKTTGMAGIVAFIEIDKDQTETLAEMLRTVIPSALIPEKIITVSHFPINSNGKIDKSLLFREYSNQIYE